MGVDSRRWLWVESMGVVSRRWVWVESMYVASGCGCKEVYRFPHKNYYCLVYSILIDLFINVCAYAHTRKHTHTLPVL